MSAQICSGSAALRMSTSVCVLLIAPHFSNAPQLRFVFPKKLPELSSTYRVQLTHREFNSMLTQFKYHFINSILEKQVLIGPLVIVKIQILFPACSRSHLVKPSSVREG